MKLGFLDDLRAFLRDHGRDAHRFLHRLQSFERPFLLQTDFRAVFACACDEDESGVLSNSPFAPLVACTQEAARDDTWLYVAMRPEAARWTYARIHCETLGLEVVPVSEFLRFKERLAGDGREAPWVLEVDLEPFAREFSKLRESDSIGRGGEFLNRRLASRLFEVQSRGAEQLLEFLRLHSHLGQQLMISGDIRDVAELRTALRLADGHLRGADPSSDWTTIGPRLRELGFEPGWGSDAQRVRETMRLLLDLLEAPSHDTLESFLTRIPMIFSIAILSPHGYFGQGQVLGRPDTGGQIVYILDQVRSLEREMLECTRSQGLTIAPRIVVLTRLIPEADGTTCDQRLEPIAGTEHAFILRVPFRNTSGEIVPHWISRFEIWPYLEQYAHDAEIELLAEIGGRPDLIIGNYSDGNLVASLMSQKLGVTQCNIAHALEKTKYLYSDLYWKENEGQYHFSCQFTADLIAMNTADFIITSTYQEIAGTGDSVGQYESYASFTMPDLYRVVQGIDVFDPKFNIVSPGADPEIYFPAAETDRRFSHLQEQLDAMIFGDDPSPDRRGVLRHAERQLIFTMARMDRIKNITGLTEWYARCPRLRETANLLVVSGHANVESSGDAEERAEIVRMHRLFDEHGLDESVRWLGMQLDRRTSGELYRSIADRRGIFVQPALFEAFGLTVIEAMSSGLPTFATRFGGPSEIIVPDVSGFHLDPNEGARAAEHLADFLEHCRDDPEVWERISRGALARVKARYTWSRYAERVMTLSRVYGFWKYITDIERRETRRYLEMFYGLQFRPRARGMVGRP